MNPDEAAGIALQDLNPAHPLTAARRSAGRAWVPRAFARVLRAWMEGWTWYARQGFAPAAVEPVFPLRAPIGRRASAQGRRWASPCPPPRFALLYGRGAGAGCP
jgi:hypothetical protein